MSNRANLGRRWRETPSLGPNHNIELHTGQAEFLARKRASALGSEGLVDAIEDLVTRTAARLAIPPEWQHRPLAFARAYLGMEA
ncbi:hypothetical protein KFK14_12830 [Sphingobium phenoxybenzoativorans]|uniref:Uncharacterized protein n=1 Tax=Sphingobium phenoxybenzoativorans TaxID=1592790 RepID=A0A975PZT3_9SPHN|nr:hypothetical protein [Sphingobium phenoxybenzoativorans]QUT04031.1 hypothetical protein KFK14_12830 [Sphingobium phenoxybenzoativorans]